MYDSSVKVPLIMCHKGHIPENQVCDEMHSGYDFMPTLLEYLGFENDEADELPGKSFLPALMGQEHKNEDGRVVVFDEYGPVRMIRSRKYKLVHRYPYGPDEFYDLEADPGETHNGIEDEQYQDMIQDMKKQMELWFLQYVDPRIDGAKEPVMGGGQRDLAGLLGPGINVYGENI